MHVHVLHGANVATALAPALVSRDLCSVGMEKGHREDVALAPTVEAASGSADREPRRRRQLRAASQSETHDADEQRLALHERMLAAMQAGDMTSLLGDFAWDRVDRVFADVLSAA